MWNHGFLSGTVTCRAFQPLSAVFGVVGRALVNVRWRGSQHRRYATHCASAVRLSRFGHHLEGPQVWPFPTWPSCKAEGLALVLGGRESRACTEGSATLSPSLCSFVARGVLDLTLGFSRSTCLYFQDFSVWLIMIIWYYDYIYLQYDDCTCFFGVFVFFVVVPSGAFVAPWARELLELLALDQQESRMWRWTILSQTSTCNWVNMEKYKQSPLDGFRFFFCFFSLWIAGIAWTFSKWFIQRSQDTSWLW